MQFIGATVLPSVQPPLEKPKQRIYYNLRNPRKTQRMCEILELSKFPMTIKRTVQSILLAHQAISGVCFALVHCTDTVAFANDSSIRDCFAPCY